MSHRLEKNLKILDELIIYCYKNGGKNITVNLNWEDNASLFQVSAKVNAIPKEDIERLVTKLNVTRQREVEENYWALGGDSELRGESELSLVGMMLDEAQITYEDKELTIHAKRLEP